MRKTLLLTLALMASNAHAYTAAELHEDCRAADSLFSGEKTADPYQSVKSTRCIAYLAGMADGYAVADYLAGKIDISLSAFCIPRDEHLAPRMVRAVLAQFDRMPQHTAQETSKLIASAFARTFPCDEKLERKR